jgi:hypothetical protein
MTITGLTAADDDNSTAATQPSISVEGTVTWIGGTIFGANPATATLVTSGDGHCVAGRGFGLECSRSRTREQLRLGLYRSDERRPSFRSAGGPVHLANYSSTLARPPELPQWRGPKTMCSSGRTRTRTTTTFCSACSRAQGVLFIGLRYNHAAGTDQLNRCQNEG